MNPVLEQVLETKPKTIPEAIEALNSLENAVCVYVPKRSNGEPRCGNPPVCAYGYCKQHRNTVKALEARNQLLTAINYNSSEYDEDPNEIEEKSEPEEEIESAPSQPPKKKVTKQKTTRKTLKKSAPPPTRKKSPPVKQSGTKTKKIFRNKWGNFEEPSTAIVFRAKDSVAIGVQDDDGEIGPLSKRDIQTCKKNGWRYEIVSNPSDERDLSDDDENSDSFSDEESSDEEYSDDDESSDEDSSDYESDDE